MIYLDNATTSFPKPKETVQKISEYLTKYGVSPQRTTYKMAIQADQLVNATRRQLSTFLGVSNHAKIAFTKNATESLNMVIHQFLHPGDLAIFCTSSHNAALRPLHHLQKFQGVRLESFIIREDGSTDHKQLRKLLEKKPKLLLLNHVSNVTGVYADIKSIIYMAKQYQTPVLLDVSQSLGHSNIEAETMDLDFVAGTGHKSLYGPSGVGFLYVKDPTTLLSTYQGGSNGNVSLSPYHPNFAPYKYEAGTLNTTAIAGLHGGLSFLETKSSALNPTLHQLYNYLVEELSHFDGIKLYACNPLYDKIPLTSFRVDGMLPSEVGYILDKEFNICTRVGLQCAPLMHKVLHTYPTGTVRISLSHFTTENDIAKLLTALRKMTTKNMIHVST